MNKLNFAGACLLAFGGFQETNALRIQSKLAAANSTTRSQAFTQTWKPLPSEDLAEIANPVRFETWNHPVRVTFDNVSGEDVELFWHDYDGNLASKGTIEDGETMQMYTYASQPWSAAGSNGEYSVDGRDIFVTDARNSDKVITIADRSSNYQVVTERDCTGSELVLTEDACKAAIKEVFGVEDANVSVWGSQAHPYGCFRHIYYDGSGTEPT